ncbi:MAG TPA: GAF domain-containing protein [Bacteroidaceae bacterium]|mgnify:CR=1 FL=1|nr:GAF domain-containing protein [Bacteroidaceae bacterium]
MAESLEVFSGDNKQEQYKTLYSQLVAMLDGESDMIANMANVAAAIHMTFNHLWVGFYRVIDSEYLVLGPFQGPIACTRIRRGKGVCGMTWETGLTQVVPDVNAFSGHIACSSLSQSEIVVPVFQKGKITGVLDIDSVSLGTFDIVDKMWLENITLLLDKY